MQSRLQASTTRSPKPGLLDKEINVIFFKEVKQAFLTVSIPKCSLNHPRMLHHRAGRYEAPHAFHVGEILEDHRFSCIQIKPREDQCRPLINELYLKQKLDLKSQVHSEN